MGDDSVVTNLIRERPQHRTADLATPRQIPKPGLPGAALFQPTRGHGLVGGGPVEADAGRGRGARGAGGRRGQTGSRRRPPRGGDPGLPGAQPEAARGDGGKSADAARARSGPPCAVVLEGGVWPEAAEDTLDEDLTIVARLRVPADLCHLDAVLTAHRPRLLLVKSSLEYLDTRLLNLSVLHRLDVLVLARPAYGLLGPVRLRRFGGLPWLLLRMPARDRAAALVRRVAEVLLITLSAPLLLPLMLLVGLAVCWDGRPFYLQDRVGEGGRIIRLVKFRTMREDAERDTGPVLAQADDPRVTPVGRLLRRTRLDELPQLWNVLRGEMSLVGPRPERPEFVRGFRCLPSYNLRHVIRPGLTGIAQLTDGYRATVEKKIRCDLLYVNCRSLRLDFVLLMLTFRDLLRGFPRG